jgi:RHS repeat-associated protein
MDIATDNGTQLFNLDWDNNGQMKNLPVSDTTQLTWNWDGKLRSGQVGTTTISLRYDPDGNRIWKQSTVSGQPTTRKYIVDIAGDLPTILLQINPPTGVVAGTFIYAHGQLIARHLTRYTSPRFFYLHDRLGSVRQLMNISGQIVRSYTYSPFGELLEEAGTFDPAPSFMFAGQWYDSEIGQYYMRARQYDPRIGRFTARDPVFGNFQEPLTLHVYLYCLNDPVNRIDPDGRISFSTINAILTGSALYAHGINLATYAASSENWKFFDLSFATLEFMPFGMAIGSISPPRWVRVTGLGGGWASEEIFHRTGMGRLEGIAMAPYAYVFYWPLVEYERAKLGISSDEWGNFLEWRGPW